MAFFLRHNLVIMAVAFLVIALALFASGEGANFPRLPVVLTGMLFLDDVIIYVLALECLKTALKERLVFKSLKYNSDAFSYSQTRMISLVSAFPFGLGVSSFLKGLSENEIETKPISEGMTTSMLIYPTTLASGYVFDHLKLTSILDLFSFGILLCLIVSLPIKLASLRELGTSRLFLAAMCLGIGNYFYLVSVSAFIEHHFMLKQSLFFIVLAIIINPTVLSTIHVIALTAWRQVFFFVCVGLLGFALIKTMGDLVNEAVFLAAFGKMIIIVPIFLIPVLSILFIHPLALFLISSPVISPIIIANGFDPLETYLVWILMLVNAQLLSPVSLTTVLAVGNSRSNVFSESFLKHYKFALKFSIVGFLYLMGHQLFFS